MARSKRAVAEADREVLSPAHGDGENKSIARVRAQQPEALGASVQKRPASRLPEALRFPLAVILSFAISVLGDWLVLGLFRTDFAAVSRQPRSWTERGLLAAWKLFQLALSWYGNYDAYDVAALHLLSRGPSLYILSTFYGVGTLAAGASLGLEVLSGFVPFLLLRPLSSAHSAAPSVFNREIIADHTLQGATVVLAGLIYHVTLFIALRTFMPSLLVLYFGSIPTVEPAVNAQVYGSAQMVVLSALFGLAARTFIFTPYATQPPTAADADVAAFDPVSATVEETLLWNFWGYTTRAKVVITHTAVVMLVTGLNTFLLCLMTINGVEWYGAAVYASVWAVASLVTGMTLGYVGGV